MSTATVTVTCALEVPVPVRASYTFDGEPYTRVIGPSNGAPVTIITDDGEDIDLLAPLSAQTGSVSNTPRDLKAYRFLSWQKNALTKTYVPHYVEEAEDGDNFTVEYAEQSVFQTRSPQRRASKLQAKTDEEVAQIRTTALKPLQVKNQAVTSYEQTNMETRLGTVLCAAGIIGNDQHHYRNFAQELYGLTKTFTQLTLTNEAKLRANKWYGRGLVWATLQTTAKLQGIDIGTSPP